MMRRPLAPLDAWRLDGEFRPHTVQETLSFVAALQDLEEERPPLPMGVILAGNCEPRWLTRLRARFGR